VAVEGIDYSFARPSPTCLAKAGKQFAVRYTSVGDSQKNMTPDEVMALIRAGLALVTVHQEGTGDLLKGFQAGVSHAQWALKHAGPCGMPRGRPVYFALDQDPRGFSQEQWRSCQDFLDGAASVLGRTNVGVYGSFMAIERLVPGWASWGWQTYAWSVGPVSGKAALYQYRNGQSLCGGEVDFDRALKDDYGQWGIGAINDMLTQEQDRKLSAIYNGLIVPGTTNPDDTVDLLFARVRALHQAIISSDVFATDLATKIVEKLPAFEDIDIIIVADAVKQALREGTGS